MKKIIIYASDSQYSGSSEILKVSRVINKNNAEVIAYFDEGDYVGMQEVLFENAKMMLDIAEINTIKYDYVVIASYEYDRITEILKKNGVEENRIVQFFNYHFFLLDELFFYDKHIDSKEIRGLFTGISAARMTLKY